jgi:hypothetical protein
MKHYSLEKWADFARGLFDERERATMQNHLEDGCEMCREALSLWKRVHSVGKQEQAYEPPESAMRALRVAFSLYGPQKTRHSAQAAVSLLFDSFRSPLAQGVRSGAPPARQLLYGVGNYRIDLRVEPQIESDGLALFGQVLDSTDPGAEIGKTLVRLVKEDEDKVVAESATNRFGEFHLESNTRGPFQLRVRVPAGELHFPTIDLPADLPPGGSQAIDSKPGKKRSVRPLKSTRKKV